MIKLLYKKIKNFNIQDYIFFNYLKNKYMKGNSVEIGPGEFPYIKKDVTYVDKYPEAYGLDLGKKVVKADADNLPFENNQFNFLISAHCLEHCPDTIATLKEWKRVVKKDGLIILILPHGKRTFDNGRAITSLKHHIIDHKNNVDIYDEEPLNEWEKISLINANPKWLKNTNATKPDGSLNFRWMAENGLIHYHVWTQNEIADLGRYLEMKIEFCSDYFPTRSDSFIIILKK